jgi:hypothetical protein
VSTRRPCSRAEASRAQRRCRGHHRGAGPAREDSLMIAREKDDERPDIDGHIYARCRADPEERSSRGGSMASRSRRTASSSRDSWRTSRPTPCASGSTRRAWRVGFDARALPTYTKTNREGEAIGSVFAFKCRLQILGVIREDVGQGVGLQGRGDRCVQARGGAVRDRPRALRLRAELGAGRRRRDSRSRSKIRTTSTSVVRHEEGWGGSGAERGAG